MQLLEEHSFDDLSVKMLCKEAGISKQTLYNHYYSIMDALEDAYKIKFSAALNDCNTYESWVEGFKCFLYFLDANRKVTLHVYYSSHRAELMDMIYRNGMQLISKGIDDCSKDIEVSVSDKDKQFMINFYMFVFMGIVKEYLDDRMAESPDYIASRSDAMMRFHIRSTLRNIHDMDKGLL